MKKGLKGITILLVVGIIAFWLYDLWQTWQFNSVLFGTDSLADNPLPSIVGICIVLGMILLLIVRIYKKFLAYARMTGLVVLAVLTLWALHGSLSFYFPWNHNEQFILFECILLYYSILSLLFVVFDFLFFMLKRERSTVQKN